MMKHKVTITVPKIGKNKRLLELAKSNAKISIQQYRQKSYYKEEVRKNYLDELKNILGVNKDLVRIESYDISHISGVDNVASMVCFTNGIKDPSEYRKFKINTVKKADDVASMKEVLERRFKRYLEIAKNKKEEKSAESVDAEENTNNLEILKNLKKGQEIQALNYGTKPSET